MQRNLRKIKFDYKVSNLKNYVDSDSCAWYMNLSHANARNFSFVEKLTRILRNSTFCSLLLRYLLIFSSPSVSSNVPEKRFCLEVQVSWKPQGYHLETMGESGEKPDS